MARKKPTRSALPNTGNEEVPPGATARAADREIHRGGGAPGSGGGPRHAAADPGSADEEYGATDSNDPRADGTLLDQDAPEELELEQQAFAGQSGGAVGGAIANGRVSGGRTGGGIRPGTDHRGDSTVGADPDRPSE